MNDRISDTALSSNTDAMVWAEQFVLRARENPDLPFDEGTMLSWFANAIMAGYDEARRKYELTNAYDIVLRQVFKDANE